MVIIEYENSHLVQDIMAAIDEVNADCLPHADSLRSFQLSEEEIQQADKVGDTQPDLSESWHKL